MYDILLFMCNMVLYGLMTYPILYVAFDLKEIRLIQKAIILRIALLQLFFWRIST